MKESRMMMGMPITVEVVDGHANQKHIDDVFGYFRTVDERFSTYKPESEISQINGRALKEAGYSAEMREVLALAAATKRETGGYFDIMRPDGMLDPSGLVKGWAIRNAADLLSRAGFVNFYIDAGGDIEARGMNAEGAPWSVGIRDPFGAAAIVKVLYVSNHGVATSGTYLRGDHIYDPIGGGPIDDIVSLTVAGPNVYDADRFATAAFAMGRRGMEFIARLEGFEGYMIDREGIATMTSSFEEYTHP